MKITFLKEHKVQQWDGNGPVYLAGKSYDFDGRAAESYALKYIRKGIAELAKPEPTMKTFIDALQGGPTPESMATAAPTPAPEPEKTDPEVEPGPEPTPAPVAADERITRRRR